MKSYTWLHAIMAYRNEWSASAWRIIALVWEYEVNGRLELSNAQIAKEIEVSERHVKRAIGELKNRGLIKSGYRYVQMHIENRSQEKGHPVSHFTDPKRDISKQEKGHPVSHFTDPKRDISKQEKGHPVSPSSLYTTIPLSDDEDLIVDSRDPETSSPSPAPGSTFGENRIADLSFENNINNSEDPASPDAPTPPLPPLAPGGYPTEWSKFDAWVELRFVHYGHAPERVCGLSFASQFSGHFERVNDACDYVETGLRNMQVDGFDTKKVTRALGHTRNIRQYLDQLRNEAAAKEITVDDLSTDPAEVERRQQERERRQREEFERDSKQPLTPDQLVAAEKGWKFIEEMKARKALRQELLERESQRESA